MASSPIELIDAALEYAGLGWRIIPVHTATNGKCSCRKAKCNRAGKHPRINQWIDKASCDSRQIFAWWKKWPQANIGVLTGAESGVVVLDVDGEIGRQTLNSLAGSDPSILETRIHRTGSGGSHLFFQHPGGQCSNAVKTLPGIDTRADGGLIVLPPSLHPSGGRFEIIADGAIATLPDSLKPLFIQCHKEGQGESRSDEERLRFTKQVGGIAESPQQNTSKRRQQLDWALKESLPKEQGRRHRQVFELARHLLAVDGITQDIPVVKLKPIVERWHDMAVAQAEKSGFTIHGDAEESWSDFQFAWGRVKHPIGGLLLRKVFDHVASMDEGGEVEPIVWNALAYFGRTENREMRILTGVLFELAQCYGADPFCLACHAGATQFARLGIDRDHKWVYRRLQSMTQEGVLECVDRGKAGVAGERRAAQYRWTWTMQDMPTNDINELLDGL